MILFRMMGFLPKWKRWLAEAEASLRLSILKEGGLPPELRSVNRNELHLRRRYLRSAKAKIMACLRVESCLRDPALFCS